MAFTLLSPWIRRLEDFYRFTQFLSSWTLLPSYAKMPSLLPYPHPIFAEGRARALDPSESQSGSPHAGVVRRGREPRPVYRRSNAINFQERYRFQDAQPEPGVPTIANSFPRSRFGVIRYRLSGFDLSRVSNRCNGSCREPCIPVPGGARAAPATRRPIVLSYSIY